MESLLNMIYSEQNIYNTQSQHFLVKPKSKLHTNLRMDLIAAIHQLFESFCTFV